MIVIIKEDIVTIKEYVQLIILIIKKDFSFSVYLISPSSPILYSITESPMTIMVFFFFFLQFSIKIGRKIENCH